MDKDRVIGAAKNAKGKVKQAIGKSVGDTKMVANGKSDQSAGKTQNTIGGIKDALRGK